jgi:hypothetical protein
MAFGKSFDFLGSVRVIVEGESSCILRLATVTVVLTPSANFSYSLAGLNTNLNQLDVWKQR